VSAALDFVDCVDVMAVLLGRAADIEITEKVLEAAASNHRGEQLLRLLLDRAGQSVTITQAVCNSFCGMRLLAFLERGGPVQIGYDIYKAAVSCGSKEMVQELTIRMKNIEVTEELLVAAAANFLDVFKIFLGRSRPEVITDEVLKVVIESHYWAFRRGCKKKITVQVAISAAARKIDAGPTIKIPLEQAVDIEITEEVVKKTSEIRSDESCWRCSWRDYSIIC
jgi:hypothetical protein